MMMMRDIEVLSTEQSICMGLIKPLCEFVFLQIYTMILFNEIERYRGSLHSTKVFTWV